jgi:hypothetical protein
MGNTLTADSLSAPTTDAFLGGSRLSIPHENFLAFTDFRRQKYMDAISFSTAEQR